MRIGVAADLHRAAPDGSDLPPGLVEAFSSVDLIALCGDIGVAGTVDRLAKLAPVVAVRNPAAPADGGGRAPQTRMVVRPAEAGLSLGLTFSLSGGLEVVDGQLVAPPVGARAVVEVLFDGPVDVVLFGSTHAAMVAHAEGVLFVNPGSPTFAERPTVAVLDAHRGVCQVELVDMA